MCSRGFWRRYHWTIHAYCLISNHDHLVVGTTEANLAKCMREFNGVYTRRFNRLYQRVGHVFQGRYKAILGQKEAYILELARYAVLNPIRAVMVHAVEAYPLSSYRAMIGEAVAPKWLERRATLAALADTESEAVAHYRRFVAEGANRPSPWEQLKQRVCLGSQAFVDAMRRNIPPGRNLRDDPIHSPAPWHARSRSTLRGARKDVRTRRFSAPRISKH